MGNLSSLTPEQDLVLAVEVDDSSCTLIRVGNQLSVRQHGQTAAISTNNIDFFIGFQSMIRIVITQLILSNYILKCHKIFKFYSWEILV